MNWNTKTANIIQIKKYARVLGVSDMMARVLVNRGISIEVAQALLENPAMLLEAPEDIVGAEAAAAKIMEYLQKPGAEIWVFADYDVDGITSGYVITDFLRRASDNEAFVYSGCKVFDKLLVEQFRPACRPPRYMGDVYADGDEGKEALQHVRFAPDKTGLLCVWDKPEVDPLEKIKNRYGRINKTVCVFDKSVRKRFSSYNTVMNGTKREGCAYGC